jgi:hypothetical protein
MYNKEVKQLKRFGFDSVSKNAVQEFDEAVQELNKIYHENGRFDTVKEVKDHFKKYGFNEIKL